VPADQRTTRSRLLGALPLVVLVGVAAVLVAVRVGRDPGADPTAPTGAGPQVTSLTLPTATDTVAAVLAAAAAVPATVLDRVGIGGVRTVPIAVNGSEVTSGGRPRIVWVGADNCAACAAMRWAALVALSRFGTVEGAGLTTSAVDQPYPGTVGPTFRGARFEGDTLAVTFYEAPTTGAPVEPSATSADRTLLRRYDAPPYVADDHPRPFVLYAGQYVSAGSLFTPAVLDGLDAPAIARALHDPSSAAGEAVDGAANIMTAVLCVTTGGDPGAVCDSAGVRAARAALGTRSS
jgi:hypothetical protein